MTAMTGRSAKILEAAIQGFIDTGEPVSSVWLYENYDFGIKPAMIRHELEKLSENGFLEQPHHSAGRMPTDSGYEFFAELAEEKVTNSPESQSLMAALAGFALPRLVENIADELQLLGVGRDEKGVYKSGIERLVKNLTADAPREIQEAVDDFVEIDERLAKFANKFSSLDEPRVFIGRKSPVTKCASLAIVADSYSPPGSRRRTILLAVGPKRMNYKKAIKTFKEIKNGQKKAGRR